MLSVEEVARRLRVNIRTIYRAINRGELRAVRVGRLWRVCQDDLDAFLAGGSGRGRKSARGFEGFADAEPLSAEDLEAVREGIEAIRRGDYVTLDEYERQRSA
ncbi:MAG: helix-turn-helix domain-containing protein [Chloroflexi bacterium]|nr:helix-turn-helix domain-containing protein [Chloroflexota bacterium]